MRTLKRSQWLVGLLCVLLIVARLGGAHWHLCLDQTSPVLSVQSVDAPCETAHDHHDVDLDAAKSGLVKQLPGLSLDLLLIAAAAFAWLVTLVLRPAAPAAHVAPAVILAVLFPHARPRAPPL